MGVNDACGGRLIGPEDCYYFFLMFLLSLRCDVKTCNPSTLAENPSNLNDSLQSSAGDAEHGGMLTLLKYQQQLQRKSRA